MNDLLLINTPILISSQDQEPENSVPPIGLGYIYTQVTLSGFHCHYIDSIAEELNPQQIINAINNSKAHFIGLNVFSSNLEIVHTIVANVSEKKTFILGGPAINFLVSEIETWNTSNKIFIVIGEAELFIPEYLKDPNKWTDELKRINTIKITPDSPFYPNNIDLPLDRTIFKNEPIKRGDLGIMESHIIASRGCMYNCGFCTAAKALNRHIKPRYRSYNSLYDEINLISKLKNGTNCIRILDDLFLRDISSIELAINLFSKMNFLWRSMGHVNTFKNLSAKTLEGIKNSGCRELFIGIESGSDRILKKIHKPFNSNTAQETIRKILDSQISVKCFFIFGFPGETETEANETLALAARLQDYTHKSQKRGKIRISVFRFRPYHGTALYNELLNQDKYIPYIINRSDQNQLVSVNPYDCVSGVYSDYTENKLDRFIKEMENLND